MLSPGNNSAGTLTINNALTNGGTLLIQVNKSGTQLTNNALKGISTFAMGGTLNVTNTGTGILTASDSIKIFSATNTTGFFAAITPAVPGTNLVWNTNSLAGSGVLSVMLGAVHPQLASVTASGGNFILTGNGGAAGYGFSVLSATNLASATTNWAVVGGGVCDGGGAFSFTNGISANAPVRFYVIRVP
jgi:hypothetical protein